MPEPLRTTPAKLFGRENVVFIPTIAATATLSPTVAEITGASAFDITNVVFADGEPTLEAAIERVRQDRRLGDTNSYEFLGATDYTGGEAVMAWQPQAAAASDGKKAWEKFPAGTTGFLARREDIAKATAFAATQRLTWVVPVEFGQPTPLKKSEGAASQAAFRAPFGITGEPKFDVAISA